MNIWEERKEEVGATYGLQGYQATDGALADCIKEFTFLSWEPITLKFKKADLKKRAEF